MSERETRIEGIIHASSHVPGLKGKQFLGAIIECDDGKEWVIDYNEQSPFHAFADRKVVVSGEPYEPKGQRILGDHLRVSAMRLVEVIPDAHLTEVGAPHTISGRFRRGTIDIEVSTLSFVTDAGEVFLVANDPAGATLGKKIEVRAYLVQLSPTVQSPDAKHLWIICPHSMADIWEWRARRSQDTER